MADGSCKPCAKRMFTNKPSALTAALRNATKFGATYRAYPCPAGNGWHLTTRPEREQMRATPVPQAAAAPPPTSQRHASQAEQRRLRLAAGDHLGVLANKGAAVMAARRADPEMCPAAHEALGEACRQLTRRLALNPCELFQLLRLVGLEAATRGWSGDHHPTNSPEGI